jgi:aromatic ring-opening dioxygenase catalytic subunit (LigB family)
VDHLFVFVRLAFTEVLLNSEEGILVLAGGLIIHNLRDFQSFVPESADPRAKGFSDAVTKAIAISDVCAISFYFYCRSFITLCDLA